MKQNFTQHHLIKYLYKETSASETLAINDALSTDVALREEFDALKNAYLQLPKVTFNPSADAIKNILGYSQRTALERQA